MTTAAKHQGLEEFQEKQQLINQKQTAGWILYHFVGKKKCRSRKIYNNQIAVLQYDRKVEPGTV